MHVSHEHRRKTETSPVPEESWDTYKARTEAEFREILDSDTTEPTLQSFFERNPSYVPGAFGVSLTSGHAPLFSSLISQPPLPGFDFKRPDFMWISTDSREISPVLIEIERPNKRWHTRTLRPTAAFTEASNQLTQWKTWFQRPENQTAFIKGYHIDISPIRPKRVHPHFVLVVGRDKDIADKFVEQRSAMDRTDETIMTFDRIAPSADAKNCLCTRYEKGEFRCISFPSTAKVGPQIIGDWVRVSRIKQCIDCNLHIAPKRRAFLKKRLDYWLEWKGSNSGPRSYSMGEWE